MGSFFVYEVIIDDNKIKTIKTQNIDKNILEIIKHQISNILPLNQDSIVIEYSYKDNKIHHFKEILIKKESTIIGIHIDESEQKEFELIFETIKNSPNIGLLIYKDKILEANEYIKNTLEIDDKIFTLSPTDIFPSDIKKTIQKAVKRRLNGEFFDAHYAYELPSFKNRRKFIEYYASTIIYKKEFAGFVIGIDNTICYKQQKLLQISEEINKILLSNIFDSNELILKVIEILKKSKFYDAVELNKTLNFPSSFSLNIKNIGTINIYSKYNDDFDNESIKILKDIENKINSKIESINLLATYILLKSAIDKGFEWVLITDENGKILYINDFVEKISKYKKEEILNKTPSIFKSNLHNEIFYKKLWKSIKNDKVFEDIIINKDKTGDLFYLKERIIPIKLLNGKRYFVSLGIDITKQKQLENKIIDISYKDQLTNLLNKDGFIIYASEEIIRENSQYALILIDIKDFHFINELIGIKKADKILKQFSQLLQTIFENTPISRIGDDEFAILLHFKTKKDIEKYLNQLINSLKKVKFYNLHLDINAGIAIFPKDANNLENLIQKASIALDRAKNKGANTYEFYDYIIHEEIENYISIKELINEAIKKKKFIYYFQPYVEANSLKLAGAESLIRIKEKDRIISPAVFIEYAEKSGLIKKIEKIMIKEIIQVAKTFNIKISFNISGVSIQDPFHMKYMLKKLSKASNLINVEITERELVADLEKIKYTFETLQNNGIEISIDDFGTGYSSLHYIKHIPFNIIKIDMSFIKNIQNSIKDRAIVDTIINFAKKLNLKTIAEGVENQEQIKILQELKCDYLQGYYFAKPMPLEEFKEFINTQAT